MVENNTNIGHAIGIAVGITILGLLLAGSANAATLTVCKSGCVYSSIQAAIDASSNGDTIQVQSGTYLEHVDVTKQLTLRGIGMPVVEVGHSEDGITLSANGIKLEGFTVNGGISGIYLSYSSDNTLSNNIVRGSDYGFSLISSSNNMLSNNIVHGSVAFVGIRVDNSNSNTLSGNTVVSDNGILLKDSTNNILTGNTAKGWNGVGIGFVSSSNNKLSSNTITDSMSGIYMQSSSNNMLSGNNVSGNNHGIYLQDSGQNTIYNNYFDNTNNFLSEGIIYGNIWSIKKTSGINIIGGLYLGGNFWANPGGTGFSQTCLDGNKDGLCNLKYSLNSNNIDNLPLTYKPAITTGITITSPNGGETWTRGTKQIIRWNYNGDVGSNVKIELLENGVFSRTITSKTSINRKSYNWKVPSTLTPGTDYKIKITSRTNSAYNDASNNDFTISG